MLVIHVHTARLRASDSKELLMSSHREPGQPGSPSPREVAPETAELPAALTGWMNEARQLVEQVGAAPLAAELDLLAAQRGRSEFRAAVVGEFNRGKSTLVNRLIGTTLLPVGPVPDNARFCHRGRCRAGRADRPVAGWEGRVPPPRPRDVGRAHD